MRGLQCWIWIVAGLGLPPAALAQRYEEGHLIEEIVVTADPLADVDRHRAQPVDVLSEDEIRRHGAHTIGELVSRQPGVSASDFGAAVGRPVIRGMSGGRVRVLEDGIGTMDLSTISADHAVAVEPLLARQVEIFRGPSTLLFGNGASGGVVNVVTDRIPDRVPAAPDVRISFDGDTATDRFTGAGSVNLGAGPFAFHADGLWGSANDYEIPGPLGPVVPNTSVAAEDITGSASYVGSRGYLGFAVRRFQNRYGVPGHAHDHEDGTEHAHDDVSIDQEQVRYDLEGVLDTPLPGLRQVRTRWAYSDYDHDELDDGGGVLTRFSNRETEGRVELVHEPVAGWDGVWGVQYRHRDLDAMGEEAFLPPARLESVAVFLLEKRDLGAWHLDLGARYEHQDTRASGAGSAGHDVYSLSAGLTWHYADGYETGISITRAERAPDIEELYARGPHLATHSFEVGDASLGEETATNFDLFWRRTAGRVTFGVNLFYNHVADFIYLRETDLNADGVADRVTEDFTGALSAIVANEDALLLVRHAQDDARFYGAEVEADINLFNDHRGDLHLRLWSDYVRGELEDGPDLPRITPWRLGAALEWHRGPLEASLEYMRVNRQDSTAPLETATPGYHMLDAYAAWTFGTGAWETTLFVRGTNLLDEEAARHTSFLKDRAPLPGRSGMFGVHLRF
jgi:iron complex outermembrane receptor protein